ncbi:uncharacterized protein LOC133889797 [Phragmites australis]|uniref:uncharacterized protein LOC133889797 n=1 Tax=Phragmites australis TaxID=29695 RepID=UPI002D79A53C|nr:uncharacterized protein LOC133889797 [Phragmites australis]
MIAYNQDPHLSSVIKAKYFPFNSFWTAPSHGAKSVFWSSIMQVKNELTSNCFYQILQGNSNIWSQPWCPIWNNMHAYLTLSTQGEQIPNIVSDLWLPNSKRWDEEKITHFFGQQAAQSILQVPVSQHEGEDILCWKPVASGICTAKEAYRHLAGQHFQPIPQQGERSLPIPILTLLNQIWKDGLMQPRVKTFAWRLLRQAIATGERAGRYSSHIDENCKRCGIRENDHHLFFTCVFARAVWFSADPPLRSDVLPEDDTGIHSPIIFLFQTGVHKVHIHKVFTTLWFIWKARNDHRFNSKVWTVQQVHHLTNATVQAFNPFAGTQHNNQCIQEQENSTALIKHSHGVQDHVEAQVIVQRVQIGGAANAHQDDISRSVQHIQEGEQGPQQLQRQLNISGIFITAQIFQAHGPLMAEAQAVSLAAKVVKSLGLNQVTYISDNQTLVTALHKGDIITTPGHWNLRPILAEFFNNNREILFEARKIRRELNKMAHSLTRKAWNQPDRTSCSFMCNNLFHDQQCPVLEALQSSSWGDFHLCRITCV